MIGSWNVRSLNDPRKQSEVHTLVAKINLAVIGLIETRVKKERCQHVWDCLKLQGWNFFDNYQFANNGRI